VTISEFAGEDETFREWIGKKSHGYVLNTHRDYPDRENTRLHPGRLASRSSRASVAGRRRREKQIKVCSPDPKELNEWAIGNLGFGPRSLRCQYCEPTSLGLAG